MHHNQAPMDANAKATSSTKEWKNHTSPIEKPGKNRHKIGQNQEKPQKDWVNSGAIENYYRENGCV